MLVWSVVLAGIIAILLFSIYPRTDYIATVEKPTYPTPIVAFINAHEAARQYVFDNYTIEGTFLPGNTELNPNRGNITYQRPTLTGAGHMGELDAYLPDGDTHNLATISTVIRCWDNATNQVTTTCNAAKTNDYLITYQPIDPNWNIIYAGWKSEFIKRVKKNDLCGFYTNNELHSVNGNVYDDESIRNMLGFTSGIWSKLLVDIPGNTLMCIAPNPGYAPQGLIVQYDGINNTGFGHSPSTNRWANLSGYRQQEGATVKNYDIQNIPLNSSFFWHDDSLEHRTNTASLDTKVDLRNFSGKYSLESVHDYNNADTALGSASRAFSLAQQVGLLKMSVPNFFNGDSFIFFHPYRCVLWPTTPRGSFSAIRYGDGNGNYQTYWKGDPLCRNEADTNHTIWPSFLLFHDSVSPAGKINNIRIYNRPLSTQEVQKNFLLDEQRYLLTNLYNENAAFVHGGYIDRGTGIVTEYNRSLCDAQTCSALIVVPIQEGKRYRVINLKPQYPSDYVFVVGFVGSNPAGATLQNMMDGKTTGVVSLLTDAAPSNASYLVVWSWAQHINGVAINDAVSNSVRVYEERN